MKIHASIECIPFQHNPGKSIDVSSMDNCAFSLLKELFLSANLPHLMVTGKFWKRQNLIKPRMDPEPDVHLEPLFLNSYKKVIISSIN